MAQQPDINAILAALAQRPGSTPQQGQAPPHQQAPPPLPAGYPQPPTPSNPLAGLALPQPSSSSNLDLSSIKPSNIGNLNLADAIAKVQASANARGGQDDPRRSYRRSRSRSPSRRDYRDNYNPYRDERREDSRRGNGRDRSYSPARNTMSPQNRYGMRSPPAGGRDDHGSEIIQVASSDVGLIIGRSGENLKRVESETGARVQFMSGPDNSGPHRQCKISGTKRQRDAAKEDIFRTAAEGPTATGKSMATAARQATSTPTFPQPLQIEETIAPSGERSMRIMVPDKTVGLIIGRGGETIRDLQDKSGCHINIVGESHSINGLRPVNLIGSQRSAEIAKDLIMQVVESDTRGTANAQPAPIIGRSSNNNNSNNANNYSNKPGATFEPFGEGEKINADMMVPSEAVGMIIGKGGETIKDMQNTSGCKINVSQPSGQDIERHIGLIGTRQAIEHAKSLIWDKVNTVKEKQGGYMRGASDTPAAPSYGAGSTYSQPQQPAAYPQPGQPAGAAGQGSAQPAGAADPYAAYGGYANYYALWMAAMSNQQSGGAGQQQSTPRPS